ncbi:hypothetical protein D3C76_1169950 [compost metagenome]
MTSCPVMASLICIPAEICPSRPAGKVSLRMAMKPVMAKANKPLSGNGCSIIPGAAGAAVQLI